MFNNFTRKNLLIIIIILVAGSILFAYYKQKKQPIRQLTEEHYMDTVTTPETRSTQSIATDLNYDGAWDPLAVGQTSNDCYNLSKRDCMKYSNCGLCMKDGKMECIPGDEHGALFKEDCEKWIYTNYYDRHIFGEKVVTVSDPWNAFYPEYEARYPSPTSRATLLY